MNKDVIRLLAKLGLKDREVRIYLACLQNKDGQFVHEIVQTTKISRSTIDLTVKRLLARGFLNKVKIGRRLKYYAMSPGTVLFRQKQLVEDLEQVVPLLSRIAGEKKEMDILYFQGAEGFRQVHQDVLMETRFATGEKKHVLSFASGVNSIRLFPDMQRAFIDKRIRNGSWYKVIAPLSSAQVPEWIDNETELRKVKYMPAGSGNFTIETHIYGDNMMLYSTVAPVGGVIIRNDQIAESMRTIFKLLWSLLP